MTNTAKTSDFKRVQYGLNYYNLNEILNKLGRSKDYQMIYYRLKTGWDFETALNTPPVAPNKKPRYKRPAKEESTEIKVVPLKAVNLPIKPEIKLAKTINIKPVVQNNLEFYYKSSQMIKLLGLSCEKSLKYYCKKLNLNIKKVSDSSNQYGYSYQYSQSDYEKLNQYLTYNPIKKRGPYKNKINGQSKIICNLESITFNEPLVETEQKPESIIKQEIKPNKSIFALIASLITFLLFLGLKRK